MTFQKRPFRSVLYNLWWNCHSRSHWYIKNWTCSRLEPGEIFFLEKVKKIFLELEKKNLLCTCTSRKAGEKCGKFSWIFPSPRSRDRVRRIQSRTRAMRRELLGSMKMRGKNYLLKISRKNLVVLIQYSVGLTASGRENWEWWREKWW